MPIWYDFISLVFPRTCESCGNSLLKHEKCICNFCLLHLPRTDFHLHADNPASRLFWGRTKVEAVASCFYFHKGSRVQHLIHGLKYKGKKQAGYLLGNVYGEVLKHTDVFDSVDVIVPVPLHPRKKRKRGYNQSEIFARGLAQVMKLPVDTGTLLKTIATDTQTRKTRFGRWENVKEVFWLRDENTFRDTHILLVDDVITTGATLESCTNMLLKCPGARVSIVTLACAIR